MSNYIQPYIRRLRIIQFFKAHPTNTGPKHPFAPKSKWQPPCSNHTYERYFQTMQKRIEALQPKTAECNLSRTERKALNSLRRNRDLTIKSADKGSCIVIEDTDQYVQNGRQHLSDKKIYQEIPFDYTPSLARAINHLTEQMKQKNHIDNTTLEFLKLDRDVRTQRLYFLKKIHKTPMSIRPIVSGCTGPTEKLSNLADYILKNTLETIPSYIKDTKDFINTIETTQLPQDCILLTIDVSALYLNIPQEEGITRILDYFYTHFPDESFPRKSLHNCLKIILQHNIFSFAGKMYKQILGTAMGTKVAPTFANIFMATVEEDFLYSQAIQPKIWKRYLDDIFVAWTDSLDTLQKLKVDLNKHHPNLTFTFGQEGDSVEFLDSVVYKGNRFRSTGILDIKPYFKPTNKFQYTHQTSCHPAHTFKGLIKGEAIRSLRLSSDEQTYKKTLKFLHKKFINRQYPHKVIRRIFNQVQYSHRNKYLMPNTQTLRNDTRIPLVLPFQPQYTPLDIKQALKKDTDEYIIESPILAFTKGTTIASKIVSARTKHKSPPKALTFLLNFPTV